MKREGRSVLGKLLHGFLVAAGSVLFTAMFFLVLPIVQAIAATDRADTLLTAADTAALPPPPAVEEPEPEPEPEEEEEPPEMKQELPPLDLSQLELALDPGSGADGWGGTLSFNLDLASFGGQGGDGMFSLSDLDQKPRAVYQASPILDAKLRKRAPGSVQVVFVVDEQGRVKDPRVMKSSDPIFEKSALAAVSQWKFEPGKRSGKPVQFRMRVTVSFPASS